MSARRRVARRLIVAFAPVLLWAVLHGLGWREHTSLLSGTALAPGGHPGQGLLYVVAWFAAVLIAPILALAALFSAALERLLPPASSRRLGCEDRAR